VRSFILRLLGWLVASGAVIFSLGTIAHTVFSPKVVAVIQPTPMVYVNSDHGYALVYDKNRFEINLNEAGSYAIYLTPKNSDASDLYNRISIEALKWEGENPSFSEITTTWKDFVTSTPDHSLTMSGIQHNSNGLSYRGYAFTVPRADKPTEKCTILGYLVDIQLSHNGNLLNIDGSCNDKGLFNGDDLASIAESLSVFSLSVEPGQERTVQLAAPYL